MASLTSVRVVVHHAHNAHPTAKINKIKDFAVIFLISVFTPSLYFIFCQKHFKQAFFCVFFHIYLMRRLSSMVNLIAVTTLLVTSGLHRC